MAVLTDQVYLVAVTAANPSMLIVCLSRPDDVVPAHVGGHVRLAGKFPVQVCSSHSVHVNGFQASGAHVYAHVHGVHQKAILCEMITTAASRYVRRLMHTISR